MNHFAILLRTLGQYVEVKWPVDLMSTLAGGGVGLLLVFVVEWIKKPRMKVRPFEKVQVNFGILYKLRFKIGGFAPPGVCRIRIEWDGKSTFAKWDETPNPLGNDRLENFRPELVPSTFDQTLFSGAEYLVPIVIEVRVTVKCLVAGGSERIKDMDQILGSGKASLSNSPCSERGSPGHGRTTNRRSVASTRLA